MLELRVLVGLGRSGRLVAFILLQYHVITLPRGRVMTKEHHEKQPFVKFVKRVLYVKSFLQASLFDCKNRIGKICTVRAAVNRRSR